MASIRARILEAVTKRGPADADTIHAMLPDISRLQARQALNDLCRDGYLCITRMGAYRGRAAGREPATFDLAERATTKPTIASVWDLARA